ncbi:MAG TPA: valine--tRNA ligase [Candidatus Dormibacteraeota bacterium]
MDKAFDPTQVEPRWRARWEELGVGHADASSDRPAFAIALPPPNVTAELHLGHAASFGVQDTLARWHRMLGDEVEWCPGTDHAAIATQNVIERQLAGEGVTKEEIGRAAFDARVVEWYASTGNRIYDQMKALGFTCDWARSRFTLDEPYVRAIRVVFKRLYDDGLIYRGPRIVNWCPRNLSAVSDEEVTWEEHEDTLVELRYPVEGGGSITVATVRPETMLGDTAVAVAPGDPRHRDLVGRTVILPLTGRRVPIIEDEAVEPEFGTGALKVTPGHDATDYEIGARHGLPVLTVISPEGRMDVPELPAFHGLDVVNARTAVTAALREAGVVMGERPYTHEVGHCDRCGEVLEPLVSAQWWVRMAELAAPALAAVEQGRIRFHPERYTASYVSWMRRIRDWCISRQLWLGHAIPVSTCANGHRFAWVDEPMSCPECGDASLTHDPDVLDTWFSSALWPFAIFGWPQDTADLRRFYPTRVLGTGRDIIFLWVARMIMMGLRFTGDIPFSDVLINSTIQAADGSRMSKSKGNGVDPLDMIASYGADAVRAWTAAVGTAGQDMRFDEKRIAAYRTFANKLWNVTRLLLVRLGSADASVIPAPPDVAPADLRVEDRWFLSKLAETVEGVGSAMEQFRFHDAIERLYHAVWDVYCDWYVELVKPRLGSDPTAAWTAVTGLDVLLRLLHPIMPFVTEECAAHLPAAAATLQRRDWPRPPGWWSAPDDAVDAVDELIALAGALRARRQEARVPPREVIEVTLGAGARLLPAADVVRLLEATPMLWARVVDTAPEQATPLRVVAAGAEATLHVATAASASDRAQLEAQRDRVAGRIEQVRGKLRTPGFTEKAPEHVVAGARAELAELEDQLASVERILGEEAA